MSKKALLIGVAVIVLALGVVGAAFATGMDFSNVGALSSGEAELAQANTDYVGFVSNSSGIHGVDLSFDRDLTEGSTIWVTLDDKVDGWEVLKSFLDENDHVIINLHGVLKVVDIGNPIKVTVTVAER